MFGLSSGNYYYGDCVSIDGYDDKLLGQSVILNTKTNELYIKIANASADKHTAKIDLTRFKSLKSKASIMTISGNADDENTYDKHPIEPKTESIKIKKQMELDIAPYSFSLITIKTK